MPRRAARALLHVAALGAGHRLAVQRAHLELDGAGARARPAARGCTRRSPRRSRASSSSASARVRIASAFARSSAETPLARKPASTPSREASHSIVSRVGRVLPRSICEMYSFEKRSPARSVCVSPAATRSWRSRSPSRGARRRGGGRTHSCGASWHRSREHAGRFTEKQSPLRDSPPKGAWMRHFRGQAASVRIT